MRIIGGSLKGKNILPPANYGARPTTDFAKEGLFNILINEYDIEDLSVLDLFSGTGSISLEFASRGCTDIISVEMNPVHAKFIKQVVQAYKVKGMQVVRHNAFEFINICTKKFDIIFLDPPYKTAYGEQAMQLILNLNLLKEDGLLIFEHAKDKPEYDYSGYELLVQKKYGIKMVSYFRVQHD